MDGKTDKEMKIEATKRVMDTMEMILMDYMNSLDESSPDLKLNPSDLVSKAMGIYNWLLRVGEVK